MVSIYKTRMVVSAVIGLFCLLMTGCSLPKPELFNREVSRQQLDMNVLWAGRFPLVYYRRQQDNTGGKLHVYLGGDGVPWHHLIHKSEDPGPYSPMVLQLMAQDRSPSIFLGRPCYQGLARLSPCNPEYWTSARYAEEIVDSMSTALRLLIDQHQYKQLVLFGYSGGGTLAVLLAARLPEVHTVVTIAGNLDTDAWTRYHYYSPLSTSLNPARLPALPDTIRQVHLQGERDTNIPPKLAQTYLQKQRNATVILYPDYNHTLFWQTNWKQTLSTLGLDQ